MENLNAPGGSKITRRNKRRAMSMGPLLCVLVCLLVTPSLLVATSMASSQALGTSLTAILAIGAALNTPGRLGLVRSVARWLPFALLAVVVHLVIASQFSNVAIGRALASLVVLPLLVIGAASFAELLLRLSPTSLGKLLRGAITLLLIIGALGCAGLLQPFQSNYPRSVFPFTEPSHFALLLTPVLVAACAVSPMPHRILYIGLALAETVVLQNLTMVVGCLLAAVTCLQLRYLSLMLLLALPVSGMLDLSYYANRIDLSNEENNNLSALVYLQGWQMLNEAWQNTYGFGLGFQQLGVSGTKVDSAVIIQKLVGDDQNLLDGGFTIAKIIAEFGVFGVMSLLGYFAISLKALTVLRSSIKKTSSTHPVILFSAGVILAYWLELAVRGAGYFTPGGLIMLAALLVWTSIFRYGVARRKLSARTGRAKVALQVDNMQDR